MNSLLSLLLRILLIAAGLVFAASLAVAFAVVLAVWLLRAGWARLTGRPVSPFVMRVDPREGFDRMYRRAGGSSAGAARSSPPRPGRVADVTDVEPKPRA